MLVLQVPVQNVHGPVGVLSVRDLEGEIDLPSLILTLFMLLLKTVCH